MLIAAWATDEWLIAPRYLIHIFAHLAFNYTEDILLVLLNTCRSTLDASQSESHLHKDIVSTKKNNGMLFVTGQFQQKRWRI